MEIKKGYRFTELGILPNQWKIKSYGEVFSFLSTAAYTRSELTDNDEVMYIHYGDIHTKFNYHLDLTQNDLPRIDKEKLKNYSLIKEGDVVMADASEDYDGVGKSIEIKNIRGLKIIAGLHTFLLRDASSEFVDGYRGYLHSIHIVKKQFDELATGLKVYGVSKVNLQKVLIPIPSKSEQTAIATALSDADALINSLEKLIEKKRAIKQGTMQELLKPKEGWTRRKLESLLKSVQLGGNYPNSEKSTGFPLIKMGNIQRGYISTNKIEFIINNIKPDECDRLKYGDILFNTRNTLELVGKVSVWRNELPVAYFNSNLMRLEFNTELISSNFFMNYILNTKYSISRLKDIATGTTSVAAIYTRDLMNIEIPLPEPDTQNRITLILSDMDSELQGLEQKLYKYQLLKQGMMQNLLTGKIRLV